MKHALKLVCCLILSLVSITVYADDDDELNIFNWTGYMPDEIIQQFENETGIKINYSTYDDNLELYTKLKAAPNHSYDLIVPSADILDKMRQENLLQRLDRSKIHGVENLNPRLLNQHFDPGNQFSMPYMWGSTSITLNTKYMSPEKFKSWAAFWSPELKDQLLMLNDAREVFNVGLKVLHIPINTSKLSQIQQAYEMLDALLPNIKLFNSQSVQTVFMDEDIVIGMSWNGDAYIAHKNNPDVQYIYPKEGVTLWMDNLAIPKGAPHLDNAYRFISFILRPDVAKIIAENIGYSSPNLAAIKLLPEEMRNSRILYPTDFDLKNSEFQQNVGSSISYYQHYWRALKITA